MMANSVRYAERNFLLLQLKRSDLLLKLLASNLLTTLSLRGQPSQIIVSGSHLDSVPAGPGINDNGTNRQSESLISCLSIINFHSIIVVNGVCICGPGLVVSDSLDSRKWKFIQSADCPTVAQVSYIRRWKLLYSNTNRLTTSGKMKHPLFHSS